MLSGAVDANWLAYAGSVCGVKGRRRVVQVRVIDDRLGLSCAIRILTSGIGESAMPFSSQMGCIHHQIARS